MSNPTTITAPASAFPATGFHYRGSSSSGSGKPKQQRSDVGGLVQQSAPPTPLNQGPSTQRPYVGSAGTKKVVILIRSFCGFELYVVDLDLDLDLESEENYSVIKPRIQNRIPYVYSIHDPEFTGGFGDGFHEWEGCVVNSTLYMFQEFSKKWSYSDYELDKYKYYFPDKRGVRKFHLSSEFLNSDESMLNSSQFLKPNEIPTISKFESLAPMNWLKCSPVAVPTPDGAKILVFDSVIEHERAHTCFELYDTRNNTWTPVKPPAFPRWWVPLPSSLFHVKSYAFIDESTFFLSTSKFPFTLDLNPKDKDNEIDLYSYAHLFSDFHSITINVPGPGPAVTISPGMAYRHDQTSSDVTCFEPSHIPNFLHKPFITLLHHHQHVYADTLVSHLHYKEDDSYFDTAGYIVIGAFHTRLDTQTLHTALFGTLKYKVEDVSGLKSLSVFVV